MQLTGRRRGHLPPGRRRRRGIRPVHVHHGAITGSGLHPPRHCLGADPPTSAPAPSPSHGQHKRPRPRGTPSLTMPAGPRSRSPS